MRERDEEVEADRWYDEAKNDGLLDPPQGSPDCGPDALALATTAPFRAILRTFL